MSAEAWQPKAPTKIPPKEPTLTVEVVRFMSTPNEDGLFFLNLNHIVALFDHKDPDGKEWTKVNMSDGKSRMFPGKALAFTQRMREGLEERP